jgi:BlaI family transcriptional regulator, penicillinase repressor
MASIQRRPTEAELGILRVLWEKGPHSVRDIQRILNASRPTGYTTVLKLLQIMTEKRLVVRDESARTHIYAPAYTEDQTQRQLVTDLLDRAFGGSAAKLVLQALSSTKTSPEELAEIKRLLDSKSGGSK